MNVTYVSVSGLLNLKVTGRLDTTGDAVSVGVKVDLALRGQGEGQCFHSAQPLKDVRMLKIP